MSSASGEREPDQLCLVTVVSSMIQLDKKNATFILKRSYLTELNILT